jgi:hypothetical protein
MAANSIFLWLQPGLNIPKSKRPVVIGKIDFTQLILLKKLQNLLGLTFQNFINSAPINTRKLFFNGRNFIVYLIQLIMIKLQNDL